MTKAPLSRTLIGQNLESGLRLKILKFFRNLTPVSAWHTARGCQRVNTDQWAASDLSTYNKVAGRGLSFLQTWTCLKQLHCSGDTRRSPSAVSMSVHRLRRWSNIEPALVQRLVFAGCGEQMLFHTARGGLFYRY